MKRLAWLLVALGTLLVQVSPVRATLRMPAASDCCRKATTCCEHPPAPGSEANDDCSVCLPCCSGCAVLPALDLFIGARARPDRNTPQNELGLERRDPPPLPPPRDRSVGKCQKTKI